jgi:hypothetical protein
VGVQREHGTRGLARDAHDHLVASDSASSVTGVWRLSCYRRRLSLCLAPWSAPCAVVETGRGVVRLAFPGGEHPYPSLRHSQPHVRAAGGCPVCFGQGDRCRLGAAGTRTKSKKSPPRPKPGGRKGPEVDATWRCCIRGCRHPAFPTLRSVPSSSPGCR